MYSLRASVYELHGGYYCLAELEQNEEKDRQELARITFRANGLDAPGRFEHADILRVLSEVCPRIAKKMDVYLF